MPYKDPEKQREAQRVYREAHREEARNYANAYYAVRREEKRASRRARYAAWRAATPKKALANLEERFWARVQKTDGCWFWTGAKAGRRYGQIRRGETMVYAHRVSWEIHYSPIPEGLRVLHNCLGGDNPACVNPVHLWLGTQADNYADMVKKGRRGKIGAPGAREAQTPGCRRESVH